MSQSSAAKHSEEIILATNRIESSDPSVLVQGLNVLTKKSFDALEANNLHFEFFPQLALSLGSLLEVVNPLKGAVLPEEGVKLVHPESDEIWTSWQCSHNNSIKALNYSIDDNMLLLTTLNILRNLSFDTVNEQVMAASTPFLQHLVSIVLLSLESGTISQATHLAIETLVNIGGRIDLTGKRRLQAYYFSEEATKLRASTDAVQRNLTKLRLCWDMSTASYEPYVTAVSSLMSAIFSIVRAESISDRTLTIRAVELLGRVASNTDNAQYLVRCPQELIDGLVQLLCTSTTFAEPLVSDVCHINGDPLGQRRPPASVHLTSRALAAAAAAPASNTTAPGANSNAGNSNAGMGAGNMNTQNTLSADSASTLNITFGGVRMEGGNGMGGYPSNTNLAALSSHGSSSSLPQKASSTNAGLAALSGMNAVASYFTEGSDLEVRDTVLDSLHALASLGPAMQARLVQAPRLVEILLRIARSYNNNNPAGGIAGAATVSGTAGSLSNVGFAGGIYRTEGMVKALQILSLLLSQVEGSRAFLALQSEFLVASCWDDCIADVVCNKALPVQLDLKARLAYSLQQQQQLDMQFAADPAALF